MAAIYVGNPSSAEAVARAHLGQSPEGGSAFLPFIATLFCVFWVWQLYADPTVETWFNAFAIAAPIMFCITLWRFTPRRRLRRHRFDALLRNGDILVVSDFLIDQLNTRLARAGLPQSAATILAGSYDEVLQLQIIVATLISHRTPTAERAQARQSLTINLDELCHRQKVLLQEAA